MGLLECASYVSICRGYDYFEKKKVRNLIRTTQQQCSAEVIGSASLPYNVFIDIVHPRKSKCNCPHADGRQVVCKHKVAVYLTAFPDEAKRIYETLIADEEEDAYDEWGEYDDEDYDEVDKEEESNRVIEYICKMEKNELQQALLQVLFDGPEWQYNHFIEERYI